LVVTSKGEFCHHGQIAMADFEFSSHALSMLQERSIPEEWLWRAINSPDRIEEGTDGNTHYIKFIQEYGGRVLRVVVNSHVTPKRIVTVFFDRRLGRRQT
jgi:hypothetical protein